MQDPNEYYEMQVTDPLKLRMGRKYDINENKDMVYWESTIDGSNFRTGPTVTPSRSLYITPDEFNNYTIRQKAVPLYEVMKRDLSKQPIPDTTKYDAAKKASNNINEMFIEISKYGGKKRKNKSRKTKKRRWSLKYKRSINCKKPKGFSQKQYCKRKGKKHLTRRRK